MSTFVLIHGAYHGGWCWDKVVPLLEKEGHKVEAPDLPGHGTDKTPIQEISLQSYVDRVCEILDMQTEPAILVGHSMGGVVMTQTAEYRPDKIKKLVFLTAILLENGESLIQYIMQDKDSLLHSGIAVPADKSSGTVKQETAKEMFYNDCMDEDINKAKSLLVPEATAPCITPVNTTLENFGRIPRIYISCKKDKALTPSIQKKMYMNLKCEKVISMNTGHSPFFSAPEELAGHLLSL